MAKVPQRGADGAAGAVRADGHHRAAPVLPVGVQDRRRALVTWPQRQPGPSDIEGPRQALRQRMSWVLPAHPQLGLRQQRLDAHPEHRRREARVIGDVQPPLARAHEIRQDGHILRRQGRSRGEDDIEPVHGSRQHRRALQLHVGGPPEIADQRLQRCVCRTHPEDPNHGVRDHSDPLVPGPRPVAPARGCCRRSTTATNHAPRRLSLSGRTDREIVALMAGAGIALAMARPTVPPWHTDPPSPTRSSAAGSIPIPAPAPSAARCALGVRTVGRHAVHARWAPMD